MNPTKIDEFLTELQALLHKYDLALRAEDGDLRSLRPYVAILDSAGRLIGDMLFVSSARKVWRPRT